MDPFLIIRGLTSGHIKQLERDKKVKSVEEVSYKDRHGEMIPMHKVSVRYPFDVPVIKRNTPSYMQVYRADIVYPLNYMFVAKLGPYIRVIGKPQELTGGGLLFSSPRISRRTRRFKPNPSIMTFDLEKLLKGTEEIVVIGVWFQGEKHAFVLDEEKEIDSTKVGGYVHSFESEKAMISGFFDYIVAEDPDILVSYNGDNFDWPKLAERAEKHGIRLDIGRDNGKIRFHTSKNKQGNTRNNVEIRGRISWDLYKSVQKFLDLKRERLKDVLEYYDLPSKLDLDATKIDKHWAEDKEKVIEYCMNDSYVTHQAFLKSRFMDKSVSLAETTLLPLEEVTEATSSRMVDSTLVRRFDSDKYAIPMNKRGNSKKKKIQGAYVYPLTAGLYHWVCSLDYRSMYSSQMIENNICWTTIADDVKDKTHTHPISYMVVEKDDKGNIIDTYEKTHWFYDSDYKKGILPQIMEELMERRAYAKKMRDSSEGDNRKYYDGLQGSLKILLNSFYGVIASYFYRFTDPRIGESITGASQNEILGAIEKVEERGYPVVGADTDSVYFLSEAKDMEGAVEIMNVLAEELSHGAMVMEPEKVWKTWFNHGKKKRYAGVIVWKDGQELAEPKTKIMGYQTQRTDTCEMENKEVKALLEAIIYEEDMDEYLNKLQKRLVTMPYEPQDYIFSSSVKSEDDYKNPSSQAQFRVAEKLRAMDVEVFSGQRVSWVVTDGSCSPLQVEPVIGDEIPEPDKKYYRERLIKTLAGDQKEPKITMVFGWDDKALRTGKKITRLDDYFLVGD